MAEEKIEARKASDRDFDIQVERLEEKGYTDIRSKLSILKPIAQRAGLTLEEAYRAKYGQPKAKERRTNDEQLALLDKQKKNERKPAPATAAGTSKKEDSIVLSKQDERIFKEMRRKDPSFTRKAFASIMGDFYDR
jgi:hypothetical protein